MKAILKMINEKYGGAEGYLIEKCGLTKEEIAQIRATLVVPVPT
jgi:hypothetical protein